VDAFVGKSSKKKLLMKSNNDSVRQKIYANDGNPEVLRHVPIDAGLKILDVGCGAGDNAKALQEQGHTVDGITLSEKEATFACEFSRNVYVHNLEQGLPAECLHQNYSYVLCSHVLEHICFPEKLLADIYKCLEIDGTLVVALPNIMFLRNRWNLLRGRFNYEKCGLMDNTHFRWYTYETSRDLFRKNGYDVIERYVTGYLPMGPVRRILPVICSKLDHVLCRAWPGLFGLQLILRCKKA